MLQASAMRVRPRLSPSASSPAIRTRLSAAVSPVRRWVKQSGKQRPAGHFGQQVGDADARQHGVEPGGEGLGLRRRRFLDAALIFSTPLVIVTSGRLPAAAAAHRPRSAARPAAPGGRR